MKRKAKEERPLTAQPLGEAFTVATSTSLKPLEKTKDGWDKGPSGTLHYGDGCFRRVPRFFNE